MKAIAIVFIFSYCLGGNNCLASDSWDKADCLSDFPPEIRKVTDEVYVAVGYALGNSIMVIAPDGLIIVDVTETINASRKILEKFREITSKPIKAIVYTHYHHDHIMGTQGFIEDPTDPPDVWSDITLLPQIENFMTYAVQVRKVRATRQFGSYILDSNVGVGGSLERGDEGFIFPNKFIFSSTRKATIAGLNVKFIRIPGESSDQIGMLVPKWKMFFSGDTFYPAFPNMYSIRGTPTRDPKDWFTSVQKIIDLQIEYLVPSHIYPLHGNDVIKETLINYRDAIQFVHDQSLRYINKGYYPNEVAKMVKLPKKLAKLRYLQQCYGTVEWSAKGVFQFYLGWFSGDPLDLYPLSFSDKAKKMVMLAGGKNENLIDNAEKALDSGDNQWALELSSYALEYDRNNEAAKNMKGRSLRALGEATPFTLAKNYYKTSALEVEGKIYLNSTSEDIRSNIYSFRMRQLFEINPALFMPEKCSGRKDVVKFKFKDTKLTVYMQLRNGIAIITDTKPDADNIFKVSFAYEYLYREIIISMRDGTGWPFENNESFDLVTFSSGFNMNKFKKIMHCFDWEVN